jgi:group II intron reverse transcriptase/maturase
LKQEKAYEIPKSLVWQAYLSVRENKGAAGYDRQTLKQFDESRDKNLYKLWNRLSSGSYMPPPVLKQEIPKANGGVRTLGIPTISDRIAQGAIKLFMEARLEPLFHPDSYGYRPNRSAHDALQQTQKRCWEYHWAVEIDIKAFFDNVDHVLILKALKHHKMPDWVLLYAQRWLEAPMIDRQGHVQAREKGTPQGGVISPLLANLFLHHGFDEWMRRYYPEVPFERYADDAILHCQSENKANVIMEALAVRMESIGLSLHPDKTRKLYVGRAKFSREGVGMEFTFLGYDFKRRVLKRKDGKLFYRIMPGAAKKALRMMTETIRGWRLHRSTGSNLFELAARCNAVLRGWINYYGKFWYRHFGYHLWSRFQSRLVRWVKNTYRLSQRKAERKLDRLRKCMPGLFAHWSLLQKQEVYSRAV